MRVDSVRQDPRQTQGRGRVKVLHTKSQAGRTQKSRPPAASFERHLLGRTVKLGTACERGRTGRTGREETEHSYETLEPELRARCTRTAHRGTSLQDRPARQRQGSGLSPIRLKNYLTVYFNDLFIFLSPLLRLLDSLIIYRRQG